MTTMTTTSDPVVASSCFWRLPGSLIEYAWTRRYPIWCRRVVPAGLEDASDRFRRLVELLPIFWKLRRRGLGYRRIAEFFARRKKVRISSTTVRNFLIFSGYVKPTEKFATKVRKVIDALAETGDFRESAKVSGFSVDSLVLYLTELGLRPRTFLDVANKIRELDHITTVEQIRREFRLRSSAPTALLKLFPDLRDLLSSRRKRMLKDAEEESAEEGIPLILLRSPRAVAVLLSLAKRPMSVLDLSEFNGWQVRPALSLASLRLDELMKAGLVARSVAPCGKQKRRVYVYALTPAGYDTLSRVLSKLADFSEKMRIC